MSSYCVKIRGHRIASGNKLGDIAENNGISTAKIAGAQYWIDIFNNLRIPQWFRVITGIVQLVGVAVLVRGYWAWNYDDRGTPRAPKSQRFDWQNDTSCCVSSVTYHFNHHEYRRTNGVIVAEKMRPNCILFG